MRLMSIAVGCSCILGSVALFSGVALGQDSSKPDSFQQQLEQMRKDMDALREENQSMRDQIDDLRARDADWLTQARVQEIKGLVADVLADADTRASLLDDGLMAGWSEHFFLASADGRFKLAIEGLIQTRFLWSYQDIPDRHRHGWEVTRSRLTFRGHVFSPDFEYLIRTDFQRDRQSPPSGGGAYLLDAWTRFHLDDTWSVRVGQFKLPFNREYLVGPNYQLAVERSVVTQNTTVGRTQGVELMFLKGTSRASVAVSDGATPLPGILSQVNINPTTSTGALAAANEWSATARYELLIAGNWQQFEDFTSKPREEMGLLVGIAGHAQESEYTSRLAQRQTEWFGWTADASLELGGATIFGSFTHHYIDHPGFGALNILGAVGQFGVYVAPKWEVFVRGEWLQFEAHGGGTAQVNDLGIGTFGVNYYIDGHDLKFTTDIGMAFTPVSGAWIQGEPTSITGYRAGPSQAEPNVVFRMQVQLAF